MLPVGEAGRGAGVHRHRGWQVFLAPTHRLTPHGGRGLVVDIVGCVFRHLTLGRLYRYNFICEFNQLFSQSI